MIEDEDLAAALTRGQTKHVIELLTEIRALRKVAAVAGEDPAGPGAHPEWRARLRSALDTLREGYAYARN